jgi:thiol-disulfide isomerase/thioredoxin
MPPYVWTLLGAGLLACAPAPPTTPPLRASAPVDETTSTLVVHGIPANTSMLIAMPVQAYSAGLATPRPADRRELRPTAGRVEVPCPRGTACMLVGRTPQGPFVAQIFASEPVVAVDLSPGEPTMHVQYRDPASVSSRLGETLAKAQALHAACTGDPVDLERARSIQDDLWARARGGADSRSRELATLALAAGRCVDTPRDDAITETVLAMPPDVVIWWPGALADAAGRVDPQRGWAIVDAVVAAEPDPERAAAIVSASLYAAERDGDATRMAQSRERLDAPELARTHVAKSVATTERFDDRFAIEIGQTLPALVLQPIDHEAAIETTGRRTLYYLTSLSCGSCKHNLPSLREFAAAHPDISVVMLVWDDDPAAAPKLAERYAPIPGTVVRPDPATRETIERDVFTTIVYPSFILADPEGRVLALSQPTGFGLEDLSAQLD